MKKLLKIFLVLLSFQVYSQSDTPCSATFLTVNSDTCGFVLGNTAGAIYQSNFANGGIPSCASPGSPDVWYKIIVPVSGAIAITTTQGTIADGGMALYSGTCANLNLIACNDDGAGNNMPVIDRSGLTPGDTLFVRLWEAWSSGSGSFNICAIESHSDCISSNFICSDKHFPRNTYGPGSHNDAYANNNCGINEYQSQWLSFKFLNSGTFSFTIFPDSIGPGLFPDYDWMLIQNNNPDFCAHYDSVYTPNVCNASSSQGILGSTGLSSAGVSNSVPAGPGNPFCPILNVIAGDIYYLFLNNYNISSSGYNIQFGGSAILDCDQTTQISEILDSNNLIIYPNPSDGIFKISKSDFNKSEIEIFNILGELIYKTKTANQQITLDLSIQPKGIYLVQVTDINKNVTYKKVIIQ